MDKTFNDLMDIVNRTKKIDGGAPRPPRRPARPVIEEEEDDYAPVEYDVEETKPKRKTNKSSSSLFAEDSAIGNLLEKKKSTSSKSSTAKKSSTSTAKKTTTKKSTTTKKTETKSTAKPKAPAKPKKPAVIPAKPIDKDTQLYEALQNSLYKGGTDISEYMSEDEEMASSQVTLQEQRAKKEAQKLNSEITKEQQEYEMLFNGSLESLYSASEVDEQEEDTSSAEATGNRLANNLSSLRNSLASKRNSSTMSVERESNVHDTTFELETGNRDLDKKIAEYYKRKQEKIDKYKAEEEYGYIEPVKASTNDDGPVDYEAIFGGSVMTRNELLGIEEETPVAETTEEIPAEEVVAGDSPVSEENTLETSPATEETSLEDAPATEESTPVSEVSNDSTDTEDEKDAHIKSLLSNLLFSKKETEAEMAEARAKEEMANNTDKSSDEEVATSEEVAPAENQELSTEDTVAEESTSTEPTEETTPVVTEEEEDVPFTVAEETTPVETEAQESAPETESTEDTTTEEITTDNTEISAEPTTEESTPANEVAEEPTTQVAEEEPETQDEEEEEVPVKKSILDEEDEDDAYIVARPIILDDEDDDDLVLSFGNKSESKVVIDDEEDEEKEISDELEEDNEEPSAETIDNNPSSEETTEEINEQPETTEILVEEDTEEIITPIDSEESTPVAEDITTDEQSEEIINTTPVEADETNNIITPITEEVEESESTKNINDAVDSETTEDVVITPTVVDEDEDDSDIASTVTTDSIEEVETESTEEVNSEVIEEVKAESSEEVETTPTSEETSPIIEEEEDSLIPSIPEDDVEIPVSANPTEISLEDTDIVVTDSENTIDTLQVEAESTNEEITDTVEPSRETSEDTTPVEEIQPEEDDIIITTNNDDDDSEVNEILPNTESPVIEEVVENAYIDPNAPVDNSLFTPELARAYVEPEPEETPVVEQVEPITDNITTDSQSNSEYTSNIDTDNSVLPTEETEYNIDSASENIAEVEAPVSETNNIVDNTEPELDNFDEIVRHERLYEQNLRNTTTVVDNNSDDNTYVMSNLPETSSDIVNNAMQREEVVEEKQEDKDDTISKEEFYNEMARLQENLINELKGNKVETESVDFFAEKEPIDEKKAETVAEELIASFEVDDAIEEIVDQEPEVEEVKVEEESLSSVQESEAGSKAEPVDPENFDNYNLLNKDVALNEEDLEYTEKKEESPSPTDNYFYLSPEDNEKKASVTDEYMTLFNEDSHVTKEVGDINIFKNIGNAVPSSEILKEKEKQESNTNIDEQLEKEIETIYTLMGIERKPKTTEKNNIKVLYVTSECQPFIASGGLADVAGSLPRAIAEHGDVDVRVVMPLYGNIKAEYKDKFEYLGNFTVHLSWRQEYCGLFRFFKDGVTYYFIDNERYFKRDTLYGYYDDGERFAYFSKAIVEALPHLNFFPDIIHCNDWQSALVSTYIKTGNWSDFRYYKIKHIYTIHNVEYQGVYGMENLKDLFGIDNRFRNDVEYNGDINLTKAAIQYCDKFTTVSNSYCDNLKQPYCSRGLHHIIIRNEYKLSGIINGIDYDFYNPATDPHIFKNYDLACMDEKVLNKKLWQDEIGLPVDGDTPMLAIVSRLVSHKGLDLITKIIHNVLVQDIQLVVVGTGDQKYVDFFKQLENRYPTKVRVFVDKYSNELARKAYAASDIFIMPSKIEPCGLSQMISSRYGSIPVVREVGGLKDSIKDFGCEEGGNGYTFTNYNPNDLEYQVNRAIKDYSDRSQWKEKMKICMTQDFTWKKPAMQYINLYKSLCDK